MYSFVFVCVLDMLDTGRADICSSIKFQNIHVEIETGLLEDFVNYESHCNIQTMAGVDLSPWTSIKL